MFALQVLGAEREPFDEFLNLRLDRLEPVGREKRGCSRLFSVVDILPADVRPVVDYSERLAIHSATRAYLKRATAPPAFVKAHADQIALAQKQTDEPQSRSGSGRFEGLGAMDEARRGKLGA